MLVRTFSLLPLISASCRRCIASARLVKFSFSRTIMYDNPVNTILRLPPVVRKHVIINNVRYLHAVVGGVIDPHHSAAEASISTPTQMQNHNHHQTLGRHREKEEEERPKELCRDLLANICDDIKSELNTEMPPLRELAHYLFNGKGKYVRPQIVFLLAITANKTVAHRKSSSSSSSAPNERRIFEELNEGEEIEERRQIATALISERQKSVCRIAEMIHTASLIHDDVIDGSDVRRGQSTINSMWGESKAVITGDYILSVASHCLSETKNPRVVQIISQVVEDLVRGEFMQLGTKTDETLRFNHYLEKTYRKTASLLANCCKAVALLAECDDDGIEAAFQYGRNLGLAFQLVDDLLDFISTDEALGKPAAADLHLGLATAPVLFALDQHPDLAALIVRRFSKSGDVATALQCVRSSDGVEQTKFLAAKFSNEAMRNLDQFQDSNHQRALKTLTKTMLHRLH